MIHTRVTILTIALMGAAVPALAQGGRVSAHDGDLVVIEGTSRVRVVRRSNATVRTIFNPAQHWLLIMADLAAPNGASDGGVDISYTFFDVSDWPGGERWEGRAPFEEYFVAGEMGNFGVGLGLPQGRVQVLDGRGAPLFNDAAATRTIAFRGSARGGGGNQSFDAVERMQVMAAARTAESRTNMPEPARGFSTGAAMSIDAPGTRSTDRMQPGGAAPVRVGGNVHVPAKTLNVPGIMPEAARQAGISGVVILEITIAADGTVADAKVLRSIPMLDQAALEAVRQWRYEPTLLNGAPVPVVMTVTVNFVQ